jgi:sugar phosphate isomerase/epimerase
MNLALSGRILESMDPRPGVAEFATLAREAGYDSVGLRPWQLPAETAAAELAGIKASLDNAGLQVCSITTTVPAVEATVPLARELGVHVLQVSGSIEELAEAAAHLDDDMRLGPQMHTGGEFESVALAAKTLDRIADPRVGVILEPANHMFARETWSDSLFEPIANRIIGCNLQSVEVGVGEQSLKLRDESTRTYRRVLAPENTQADFPGFFAALRAVGYQGYVDVIEPAAKDRSAQDLARATAAFLRPLCGLPEGT